MQIIKRDPSKAYLSTWLEVPKKLINTPATMSALSFQMKDRYTEEDTTIFLWKDAPHHLLVPRAFWEPSQLPCEVIDCRPTAYQEVEFGSRIHLDHRLAEVNGKKLLQPTGDNVQRLSLDALRRAHGGVLQLACVSGSTKIQLNRGGKGFTTTIAEATARSTAGHRYAWDSSIPTYVRADIGGRVGLHKVDTFIDRGLKPVYELTLADGKTLRATGDHEVLTSNRGWVQLMYLTKTDLVMVETKRERSVRKKKPTYRRIGGFNHHPFARLESRSYMIEEHRAIAEARQNGLTLETFLARCRGGDIEGLSFIDPKNFHVHHRDGNHKNNDPDNLEVETIEEHLSHHRPGAAAFGLGLLEGVRVRSVRSRGVEHVYDIACADPHHNFVANGIVVHNCGKGKTVVALQHIVQCGVPAIIMLDNMNLLRQWEQDVIEFLDVPGGVGFLHAGKFDWKKNLVLATYHTVAGRSDELAEEVRRWFGVIIWDEGHHLSAPLFSKTATAFYGQRVVLTATPKRSDGYHIICDFHVGRVVHKDLRPMMKPRIIFKWTGIALDLTSMDVHRAVCDVNGEVHMSKVESYLAGYRPWLHMLMQDTIDAAKVHRRILVLTDSVAEAANLFAMWTRGWDTSLYTDIPLPTIEEVGELIEPLHLPVKQLRELADRIKKHWKLANSTRYTVDADEANRDMTLWTRTLVQKKLVSELEKRRRKFLKDLLKEQSTAGIMTYRVPDDERQAFVESRQVIFAITKYGKEGLDSPKLDTVMVSSLFSDPAGLQQLMGRPTRPSPGKKSPTVVFYVHNIGQCIGMAKKLQQHLREWPHDEGGPYDYDLINYPGTACTTSTLEKAFGQ